MVNIELGRRFREVRLRLGLSQCAMAERLGLSERTWRRIEHDETPVKQVLVLWSHRLRQTRP
jgi:transcriptional regulator with XRE-family HTH domain